VIASCRGRQGAAAAAPERVEATVRASRADVPWTARRRLGEKAGWRNLRRFVTEPY